MQHIFDVDIANEYGLVDAIIFQHIGYWVDFNEANEKNFHDGYYWTYNSIKAFEKQFPYLSTKKIRGALERLENNELIISGEFNEMGYDRTKWYTLSQKGKCIMPKGQMELAKRANRISQKGEPIPYIKPYIKTDNIKENILKEKSCRKVIPPTVEMVEEYCLERGNGINAQAFCDFYESKGWFVGKTKMKDWQATVRTWENKNGFKYKPKEKVEETESIELSDEEWLEMMKAGDTDA